MAQYKHRDKLFEAAKKQGLRSRAAFKLEELESKFRFLRRAAKIVDLGCSPGGWLQVAATRVGPQGVVIGVDLEPVTPFREDELGREGEVSRPRTLVGDVRSQAVCDEILREAGGPVDVLLSDMSPKLTGINVRDAVQSAELVEIAFQVANTLLKPGGTFVAKIFPSSEADKIFQSNRGAFERLDRVSLDASRKTSKELYFVGRKFLRKR